MVVARRQFSLYVGALVGACGGKAGAKVGEGLGPVALDLVVHFDGGQFVDRDDHALAEVATVYKVLHDVAGDDEILVAELAREAGLLGVVELGVLEEAVEVLAELTTVELDLGKADPKGF